MLFFPGEPLRAFLLAGALNVRQWHLQVSLPRGTGPKPYFGTWVTSAVVLLIIIAVVCAFMVDRQARQLSQMQSDFVANVSHQLKTPLSLLSTAIDTLCMGRVPSDRINQYLGILSAQTSRMTRLVDRILQFARMESGTDIHRMEPVDLVPLVQTTVTDFALEGLQARVPISFDPQSDVIMARADPVAIEEAVANLLENAMKYGDDHNEVHVSVQRRDGEALVSVRDRGIGVHTSDLPYIFDKFYRGRRGADHGRRGFGLGLALVRSIARAHGGRVTVSTTYNSGSTFTLVIPALSMETSRGSSDSAD
jgi:two-component system phosphate regulon sensor histidine kinase PhoR